MEDKNNLKTSSYTTATLWLRYNELATLPKSSYSR